MVRTGSSAGRGSVGKTSRPAPAMRPSFRAARRASWSTRAAREVLTRYAVGFSRASSRAPMMPRLRSPSFRWRVTTSLSESSASRPGARRAPCSAARSSVRLGLQAATSMPKAAPIRATWEPIRPRPTTPRWRPCRSAPRVDCQGPPVRRAVFSATRLRARPRMRAQVSSTGGAEELAVPQTVTPWARAAARSIAALRMPEATSRRRRGRRAKREAGKGTRSRRVTMMSKSAKAATSSSSVPKWVGKAVSSTRSRTGDQSAAVVATPW